MDSWKQEYLLLAGSLPPPGSEEDRRLKQRLAEAPRVVNSVSVYPPGLVVRCSSCGAWLAQFIHEEDLYASIASPDSFWEEE